MDARLEFEELARPHVDALYRTALRMAGRAQAAEDLVQEAFLKAFKNFHRFERGTNFKAWIFTILANASINEYRRGARAPAVTDFAEREPAAGEESVYLSAGDVERLGDRLGDEARRALAKLPPEFRQAFLLSTFEDLTYREIAGVTGIPLGTVMSRIFRARKVLREELAAVARSKGHLKGRTAS